MTKWWILLAAAAVAEITFALYIWTYKPPLPSEPLFADEEAVRNAQQEQMEPLMNAKIDSDPRAAWTSYLHAAALGRSETAYNLLSERSRTAFEQQGGIDLFKALPQPTLDIGRTTILIQSRDSAILATRAVEDGGWLRARLICEAGQWRVEARPAPDRRSLLYRTR